jgi:hypothetical protein
MYIYGVPILDVSKSHTTTESVPSCDITLPLLMLMMMIMPFFMSLFSFYWFNSSTHFTSVIIVEVTFGWLFLWLLTIFTNGFLLILCCNVDYLCFIQRVTSICYRPLPFLYLHIAYLCHFWVMHFMHSWFQAFAMFCMFYAFFWVIPPASEFYMPTFRNTLSVPSS